MFVPTGPMHLKARLWDVPQEVVQGTSRHWQCSLFPGRSRSSQARTGANGDNPPSRLTRTVSRCWWCKYRNLPWSLCRSQSPPLLPFQRYLKKMLFLSVNKIAQKLPRSCQAYCLQLMNFNFTWDLESF